MDGEPKEKPQLTDFTRSGDRESTKRHQEEGREGGISEAKATANPRFSGNILVYGSPPKRAYIWPDSYHLMQSVMEWAGGESAAKYRQVQVRNE